MKKSHYRKFYKEAKSLFPFFGKAEKAYLRQYQSEIDTYLEEFPNTSYNDMKETIGSPKDVVFSYYDNIENDDLMDKIRISKYFKRISLIILGICILYFQYNLLVFINHIMIYKIQLSFMKTQLSKKLNKFERKF